MSNEQALRDAFDVLPDSLKAHPGVKALYQHALKALALPTAEPVDERALKDAFQEGYWARTTYNDSEVSNFEEEWNKSDAKSRASLQSVTDAVLAEREACIEIVARHGGSIEIEAAIRARGKAVM